MKLQIYSGNKLLSTVSLVSEKIVVAAAPGTDLKEQREFIESLRRKGMSDKDLFNWLPRRLRSHVYAIEIE